MYFMYTLGICICIYVFYQKIYSKTETNNIEISVKKKIKITNKFPNKCIEFY